jgi:hypothetical protein
LTAFCFAKEELGLTLVNLYDWFHRCWNDCGWAVRASGLHNVFVQSLLIYNVSYGPWKSCAWYQSLVEVAADLSKVLDENSIELLRLWECILVDKGLHTSASDDVAGPAARKAFVEQLQLNKCFTVKGSKCATSRWFSWHHGLTTCPGSLPLTAEEPWVSPNPMN